MGKDRVDAGNIDRIGENVLDPAILLRNRIETLDLDSFERVTGLLTSHSVSEPEIVGQVHDSQHCECNDEQALQYEKETIHRKRE